MVELRKRKEPPPTTAATSSSSKRGPTGKKDVIISKGSKEHDAAVEASKPKDGEDHEAVKAEGADHAGTENNPAEVTGQDAAGASKEGKGGSLKQGDKIDLEGFGGEVQLEDESKATLKGLLEASGKGIVIFTYPKASTPGCTKQACLFRDAYTSLTSSEYGIYGLSRDSPKSNANFKSKQSLQYNLICDAEGTLLKALGLAKAPKSAIRGVVIISKEGEVLGRTEGGPDATLEAARKLVEGAKEDKVEETAQKL